MSLESSATTPPEARAAVSSPSRRMSVRSMAGVTAWNWRCSSAGCSRWRCCCRISSSRTARAATTRSLGSGQGRLSPLNYSLIGPLFSAPLWLLGRAADNPVGWVLQFNLLCLAAGLLALYLVLRPHVDRRVLGTLLLLLVAASMFPNHVRYYYGEVFTAICVGAGLAAVVFGGRRTRMVGWAAVVLGTANTPPVLAGLAAVTLVRLYQRKRLRDVVPLLAAGALVLAEAWLRRGSPFAWATADDHGVQTIMPYSGLPGFSYPLSSGCWRDSSSFWQGADLLHAGLFLPMRRALSQRGGRLSPSGMVALLLWLGFVAGLGTGLRALVGVVRRLVLGTALLPLRLDSRRAGAGGAAAATRTPRSRQPAHAGGARAGVLGRRGGAIFGQNTLSESAGPTTTARNSSVISRRNSVRCGGLSSSTSR